MAGLAGAEVHLVYSARDLARQIPAEWQEGIKHQRKQELRRLPRPGAVLRRTKPTMWFWRVQSLPDVLSRWSKRPAPGARAPRDRAAGRAAPRDLLWQRYCQAFGIDPRLGAGAERPGERLDRRGRDHAAPPAQPAAAAAAALGGVPPADPRARSCTRPSRSARAWPMTLPPPAFPWADEVAEEWIEWIVRLRHRRDRRRRGPPPGAARAEDAVGQPRPAAPRRRWSTPRSTRSSRWPWRPPTRPDPHEQITARIGRAARRLRGQ